MIKHNDNHWKIDRRIPIALIVTLAMQMLGALILATELDARVSTIEKQRIDSTVLHEKFARLDERLDAVKNNLDSITRQLEKITEHMLKK